MIHRARPGVVLRTASGLVLLPVLLGALAGCGGSSTDDAGATPSCQATLAAVQVPQDGSFPTDWAFPPGTVVTETQPVPGGQGLAISAQVGSDFETVLPFMQHDLEDAGFVATKGEAEKDDAEAVWSGNGFSGTWAIKANDACPGTTLLQVAAQPTP